MDIQSFKVNSHSSQCEDVTHITRKISYSTDTDDDTGENESNIHRDTNNCNTNVVRCKGENGCAGLFIETDKPLPLSAIRNIPLPITLTNFWKTSKTYKEPNDVLKKTRCDSAFISCETRTWKQSGLLHAVQNNGLCCNSLSILASENERESSSSLCDTYNLEERREQMPKVGSLHDKNHHKYNDRDNHSLALSRDGTLGSHMFLDHPDLRNEAEIFERKVGMYSYFRRRWSRR
jgi:hypothetical protein